MAMAIPIIMAVMAVVGAVSAIRQGQAAKAAANFNAQISEQNAQISRQDAKDQEIQQQRETYLRLGRIRAAQGASGGEQAGSVLDVLGDVGAQSELERQHIIYQGELRARGYTNTANLDRFQGKTASDASYMKAGSELIGGAASAYGSYGRLNRV